MDGFNQDGARHWLLGSSSGPYSIKARLLISIAAVLFLTWSVAAVYTKLVAFERTRSFLTVRAESTAENWIAHALSQELKPAVISGRDHEALMVWKDGRLIIQQGAAHHRALSKLPSISDQQIVPIAGDQWIVATKCAANFCARAAIRDSDRKYAVRWLVATIYLPLLAIFGLAMVGVFFAMRYSLAPLRDVAEDLSNLNFAHLKPLPERRRAREIIPLTAAIDVLISNIKKQLERERRFLDACAHEIRTPVTGLVSQIQVLEGLGVTSRSVEHNTQLAKLRMSALRVVRVANQFLTLARTQNTLADLSNVTSFDLCELVRETVANMAQGSDGTEFEMAGQTHLMVSADPVALEVVAQNLVDNALRHGVAEAKECGKVLIAFSSANDQVEMCIEDNGPGVPAPIREQITEPFFRVPCQSANAKLRGKFAFEQDGAGMGLNIVNEIVESYEGNLSFSKSAKLGGLSVSVTLNILTHNSEYS